jgi:2-oxoglutarate ferredoxin oxidoreductase subunit gamma
MKIILAGEGGQGVQTIAETLAYAATLSGLESSYLAQFGVEQRGAPSIAYVQIENAAFNNLHFTDADIVVILRERAIDAVKKAISPHTIVIFDSSTIACQKIPTHHADLLGIPATAIAREKLSAKVFNTIILGAISRLIFNLDKKFLWQALEHNLGEKFKKNPEIREQNRQALELGYQFIFQKKSFEAPKYQTADKPNVSDEAEKKSFVNPDLCKGCGICVLKCPVKAISMTDKIGFFGNPIPQIDNKKCILCGNCSFFCPDTAIQVKSTK